MNEETRKDIVSYAKGMIRSFKTAIVIAKQKKSFTEADIKSAITNLDEIIERCSEIKESLKQIKL